MTFDLHPAAMAARDTARAFAAGTVAPVALDLDAAAALPADLQRQARAALPADVAADAVAWVVAVEELAAASPAVALTAAGAALGVATREDARAWTGLRGADVDGLRAGLDAAGGGGLAITAALVGTGRAALEHALTALRAAKAAGTGDDAAQAPLADAATLVDGARLLLWDAARGRSDAAAAGGMARLVAIEACTAALAAAERATDADASRPGTPLERLTRDLATAVRVFGAAPEAQRAVAAAVLPA